MLPSEYPSHFLSDTIEEDLCLQEYYGAVTILQHTAVLLLHVSPFESAFGVLQKRKFYTFF